MYAHSCLALAAGVVAVTAVPMRKTSKTEVKAMPPTPPTPPMPTTKYLAAQGTAHPVVEVPPSPPPVKAKMYVMYSPQPSRPVPAVTPPLSRRAGMLDR